MTWVHFNFRKILLTAVWRMDRRGQEWIQSHSWWDCVWSSVLQVTHCRMREPHTNTPPPVCSPDLTALWDSSARGETVEVWNWDYGGLDLCGNSGVREMQVRALNLGRRPTGLITDGCEGEEGGEELGRFCVFWLGLSEWVRVHRKGASPFFISFFFHKGIDCPRWWYHLSPGVPQEFHWQGCGPSFGGGSHLPCRRLSSGGQLPQGRRGRSSGCLRVRRSCASL